MMRKSALTIGTVAGTGEHGNEIYTSTEVRKLLYKRAAGTLKDYPSTYILLNYVACMGSSMTHVHEKKSSNQGSDMIHLRAERSILSAP
jgi:hypothetical protein